MQILRYVALSIFLVTAGVGHASGRPIGPINGWVRFCSQVPRECVPDFNQPSFVRMSPNVMSVMSMVNRYVNHALIAQPDPPDFDEWRIPSPGETADCEDFQLLKRRMLEQAGLPHRAMRMTVVVDETGQGHAVLIIVTDQGDYVLDNKRDDIRRVDQINEYIFVKRESDNGGWETM